MTNLPLKTVLFMTIHDAGTDGIWENEAVDNMLASDNVGNEAYWRDMAKFWLSEMAGNGVIAVTEQKDDDQYYGRPSTLSKFTITDLGIYRRNTIL